MTTVTIMPANYIEKLIDEGEFIDMKREVKRGDVYYAYLDKGVGSEQTGARPVVIIQNNKGNHASPTVIISPITTRKKRWLPTHVVVADVPKLREGSKVLLEQMFTIDKRRLEDYLVSLDPAHMDLIDDAIAESVELRSKMNPPLEMCLCGRCLAQFRTAGNYVKRSDYVQIEKDECDFCGRGRGYDYKIYSDKKKIRSKSKVQNG